MKNSSLHSLVNAKVLYSQAKELCNSGDTHMCTVGLIILDDAVELILHSIFEEKEVIGAEHKRDKRTFEELIGDLTKYKFHVPNVRKLKNMHAMRNLAKHHGELIDQTCALDFLDVAEKSINSMVMEVFGKEFDNIELVELIEDSEAKEYLLDAVKYSKEGKYFYALQCIRKAIYVVIEHEYSIYGLKEFDPKLTHPSVLSLHLAFVKAPEWCKNRNWIIKNVRKPTDYIQLDYERVKLDALEWGISVQELHNLFRLTPNVFRVNKDDPWCFSCAYNFELLNTKENTKYCLDKAVHILCKIQNYKKTYISTHYVAVPKVADIKPGTPIYRFANTKTDIIDNAKDGCKYECINYVSGFNDGENFMQISLWDHFQGTEMTDVAGFVLIEKYRC